MASGNYRGTRGRVRRMTGIAILMAVIIVVQIICSFIKFGPFNITLALAPIIVGAALYGVGAGAFLGVVFGVVVLIAGILGWDGGTVMILMGINPAATVAICIVKGLAAGLAAGGVYALLERKSRLAAVVCAGIVCPVVNTGLFVGGMFAFFHDTLVAWGTAWGGEGVSLFGYIFLGLTGGNFLVELGSNLLLSSAISRIIQVVRK